MKNNNMINMKVMMNNIMTNMKIMTNKIFEKIFDYSNYHKK